MPRKKKKMNGPPPIAILLAEAGIAAITAMFAKNKNSEGQ